VSSEPVEEYQAAFARIEGEVDKGNTDLADLGFWRLCRQVKLEPRLAEHWADQVGRIDQKAFRARVRPTFPVWLGNLILILITTIWIGVLLVVIGLGRDAQGDGEELVPGLIALAAAGGLSVTVHDLAHFVVGRLVGIRFTAYFLHKPLLQPGLKIDYASYLRTAPSARAWMHASGAIASKIAPFAVFAAVYLPHRAAGYDLLPPWSLWAILGLGVLQILTDILFSTRKSDWKRFRRERQVARSMESIPRR
jgi:hypothetical protein